MGLNVGGLFVRADGVGQAEVVAAIKAFWAERGASELQGDPLALAPLKLGDTGQLGFVVSVPEAAQEGGPKWIAVVDSERYHGDQELAAYLAGELGVQVVEYQIADTTNYAGAQSFGPAGIALPDDPDEVIDFVEGTFPYSFVYYNHLDKLNRAELDAIFAVFGFEGIPHREKAAYSGPSTDRLETLAREAEAERLAEAHDGTGLRALVDDHPDLARKAVDAAMREPLERPEGLAIAKSFAEDAIRLNKDLDDVAEVAARAGDQALLDRAVEAMKANYWFGLMEHRAMQLVQAGELVPAWWLNKKLVEQPTPSLTAWNNSCYLLCHLDDDQLPPQDEMLALMDRAARVGPQNPSIYHNLACLAHRLGEDDRALDAVEGAVRYGYDRLAELKADEDLRVLWDHPRFVAAFSDAASGPIDLDELIVRQPKRGRGDACVFVRPGFVMRWFFFEPLATIGPSLAEVLKAYLADVPADALTHYRNAGRVWTPLKKAKRTRDLNGLGKLEPGMDSHMIAYGPSEEGEPGDYGVFFEGHGSDSEFWEGEWCSELELVFPWRSGLDDPEGMAERFVDFSSRMPFECGSAGLVAVPLRENSHSGGELAAKLDARYLGFESHPRRQTEPGTAPGAHWLTLLSSDFVDKLGGGKALREATSNAKPLEVQGGLCLRASRLPPLGPASNPADLGALPEVARALAPLAIHPDKSDGWYRRHDDRESSDWENG